MIPTPGATTSIPRLPQLPPCLAEKAGTVSSDVLSVPFVSAAPTARTNGLYAGFARPGVVAPSLPAAATTTIPAFHATSAAQLNGSLSGFCGLIVPNERLSTRMFNPLEFLFWTTQSTAAITWETSTAPSWSATLSCTSRESGAMPRKSVVFAAYVEPEVLAISRPAMIPPMWVPWP